MGDLFAADKETQIAGSPLADLLRPKKLAEVTGQPHLTGYKLHVEQALNSVLIAFKNIKTHVTRFDP